MTQPSLLGAPVITRPTKRGSVRATSIAAYADGRERFIGRKALVLRVLAAYWNRFNVAPTSAELAAWGLLDGLELSQVLLVRRGLSDLQTAGVVEAMPNGKRGCTITGSICHTWRVIPAGRT